MSKILDRVLEMIQAGESVKSIASDLKISESNVSARLSELRGLGHDIPKLRPGTKPAPETLDGHNAALATDDMIDRCAAHLADLDAVYQRPVAKAVDHEGVPKFYRMQSASQSYCGSPSAMIAEFG